MIKKNLRDCEQILCCIQRTDSFDIKPRLSPTNYFSNLVVKLHPNIPMNESFKYSKVVISILKIRNTKYTRRGTQIESTRICCPKTAYKLVYSFKLIKGWSINDLLSFSRDIARVKDENDINVQKTVSMEWKINSCWEYRPQKFKDGRRDNVNVDRVCLAGRSRLCARPCIGATLSSACIKYSVSYCRNGNIYLYVYVTVFTYTMTAFKSISLPLCQGFDSPNKWSLGLHYEFFEY